MQLKLTSLSSVARSFILVAACVAAPLFCASRASADISGFVTAWGATYDGQCTIPASANSGVTAIACGDSHTIALKNGAVLAWGAGTTNQSSTYGEYGQCIIPAAALSGVTAIAGGYWHTIALKDGAVLAWGQNI